MARKKGTPKTGGRKKGTPNKWTAGVKEALHAAFDQIGGVPALVAWGKKNPAAFFALWVKTLPRQIQAEHTGAGGGAIEVKASEHHARLPDPGVLAGALRALGLPLAGDVPADGAGQPVDQEGAGGPA